MSSVAGKVFALVFLMIGAVALFGVLAFIVTNSAPVDATINDSMNAYYNSSQLVNQTMEKTIQMQTAGGQLLSPLPLFVAITVLATALFVFLVIIKRRRG